MSETSLANESDGNHCYHMLALNHYHSQLELIMANLSVRKLDDETLARLRMRAAQHGVSMEEEVRRILNEVVSAPERLGDLALKMFGPNRGVDLELPKRSLHEPVELSE